mmetsp:Transcript_13604/g.37420  ORF Transcript_13604/g.37420 Transcript_13604/m.37420 type:complete len:233 (+) Transcript_13604:757-1455(+)
MSRVDGCVDLHVEFLQEGLGDQPEEAYTLLGHHALVLHHGMLGVALQPQCKPARDAALREEAPQGAQLLGAVAADDAELRHLGGQATDQQHGDDESHHEGQDGKHALGLAYGCDLFHAARELREAPVHGHQVGVREIQLVVAIVPHPCPCDAWAWRVAYDVPQASHDVGHKDHPGQELRDVDRDEQLLRADALDDQGHGLLHPKDAQEPQHADDPDGACHRLRTARHRQEAC